MAADLAESQNTDRAGYGNLCTGFNSDGGQTPAGSRIIRGQLAARSLRIISAQKSQASKRSGVRNDTPATNAAVPWHNDRLYQPSSGS